jgi:AP-3 complex subunit mu
MVNCRLSGMPDLNLWFLNARALEDVSFHPCVRYNRWDQNRVVSFVPPDGVFKLLNYRFVRYALRSGLTSFRATASVEIPLHVKPQISFVNTGGRVHITLTPKSTVKQVIAEVQLVIPFSRDISSTNLTATFGTVQYDEVTKVRAPPSNCC